MGGYPDLDVMARRVIDANHYMTVATRNPDGRPRLPPLYHTAAGYADFYSVSSADAQHSRNLTERPEVEIVIFDSTRPTWAKAKWYTSRPSPEQYATTNSKRSARTKA
jgi:nitroimidazol reductase NimA-like FMN-containing flavoprotein (pyridoxamine 5'-phosphate oxidase superfamily)